MLRRDMILGIGGVIAAPAVANAQQKTMPVIGFLNTQSPGPTVEPIDAGFRQGLEETGYVESRNVAIAYRWAEGHNDRLPGLAADLVEHKVDVVIAGGGVPAALAAQKATTTIPIVFAVGIDPVAGGLVASLAHPGGNLTGVSFLNTELTPKRLEMPSELIPQATVIALLVNPNNPAAEGVITDAQEGAKTKRVQLHVLKATSGSEIDTAFTKLVELRAGALIVVNDPLFFRQLDQLLGLASRYAVPTIYPFPGSGGLVSYGTSLTAAYHLVGIYAGKILGGAKPADLPVQQPTTFELVINLKTAKALGLTVPPLLLAEANEVIE
jgi:putative tryptophan/tyrosine transport system substrate-binding protein